MNMNRLIAGPGSSVFLYFEGIEFSKLSSIEYLFAKRQHKG